MIVWSRATCLLAHSPLNFVLLFWSLLLLCTCIVSVFFAPHAMLIVLLCLNVCSAIGFCRYVQKVPLILFVGNLPLSVSAQEVKDFFGRKLRKLCLFLSEISSTT